MKTEGSDGGRNARPHHQGRRRTRDGSRRTEDDDPSEEERGPRPRGEERRTAELGDEGDGEPGQGDLVGWLSLWLPPYGLVALKLELEIKMPSGTLSKRQLARRDELSRAGAVYLSTKSVKSSVDQLALVRDAVSAGRLSVAKAVEAAEGLGW